MRDKSTSCTAGAANSIAAVASHQKQTTQVHVTLCRTCQVRSQECRHKCSIGDANHRHKESYRRFVEETQRVPCFMVGTTCLLQNRRRLCIACVQLCSCGKRLCKLTEALSALSWGSSTTNDTAYKHTTVCDTICSKCCPQEKNRWLNLGQTISPVDNFHTIRLNKSCWRQTQDSTKHENIVLNYTSLGLCCWFETHHDAAHTAAQTTGCSCSVLQPPWSGL